MTTLTTAYKPSEPNPESCALHVIVPIAAKRRAKIAAEESGLRFKEFVTRLLMNAHPVTPESEGQRKPT